MSSLRRRIVAAVLFLVSNAVYVALGIRFDTSPLGTYWQYVDPELLRHDLFRSLWYQHTQPPLYNLFLGTVLHVAGHHAAGAFHLAYLAAGVVFTLALQSILERVGASPAIALVLTLVIVASPAAALYETWLYVEYLVAVALAVSGALLLRFRRNGRTRDLVAFFAVAASIVLSRSLFSIVWLAAVVAVVLVATAERRKVLAAAAVPFVLCAGLYVKNWVLFDSPNTSSCLGLNLSRIATFQLDDATRRDLVRRGVVSKYALLSPYALPVAVREVFAAEPRTGVPLLDRPLKSTGTANLDHRAYLDLCRRYSSDASAVVRSRPGVLLLSAREAALVYFRPAGDYPLFAPTNIDALRHVSRAYDVVVLGQARQPHGLSEPRQFASRNTPSRLLEDGLVLLLLYPAAVVAGIALWRTRGDDSDGIGLFAGFAVVTVVYVTVVGNVLEAGENNRFHFPLDPLMLALVVAGVARALSQRATAPRGPTAIADAGSHRGGGTSPPGP